MSNDSYMYNRIVNAQYIFTAFDGNPSLELMKLNEPSQNLIKTQIKEYISITFQFCTLFAPILGSGFHRHSKLTPFKL